MNEEIVSFETAKLAKEKEFENKTSHKFNRNYYNHLGELNGDVTKYIKAFVNKEDITNFETIDAPTQSLLQRWLRKQYGFHIHLYFIDNILGYQATITDTILNIELFESKCFVSYEQALEEGLYKALKLIKTK